MKKFIGIIICLFLVPLTVSAKEKVKVYMFEAGGCPYCEQEETYLKGLSSYNKEFTLEKKELYEDHELWKPGKDFYLGVKVANAFLAYDGTKFKSATYQGTPFVVISDLYAAAAYSTDLESIIHEAYTTGDKDIVGCIADSKDECLPEYDDEEAMTAAEEAYDTAMEYYNYNLEQMGGSANTNNFRSDGKINLSNNAILILAITVIIIFIFILIIVNVQMNKKSTVEKVEPKEEKKTEPKVTEKKVKTEVKKAPVKKTAPKKTTTTKSTTKKATKKTTK